MPPLDEIGLTRPLSALFQAADPYKKPLGDETLTLKMSLRYLTTLSLSCDPQNQSSYFTLD
jgi:hypothetical protein